MSAASNAPNRWAPLLLSLPSLALYSLMVLLPLALTALLSFQQYDVDTGVKGGFTHGSSDDLGFKVATDKVHVHDLQATILHLLGFNHETLTYRYAGRDFRLTDVEGEVVKALLA